MKPRDPFLNWLLIMVTLGQYMWVWVFLLARDANRLAGIEYIQVRKHAKILGTFWGLYILGLVFLSLTPTGELASVPSYMRWGMVLLVVTLMGYFFWLLCSTAEVLRREGVPFVPSDGALILYSLLYMSSLPLLQSRLNHRPRQALEPAPDGVAYR